MDWLNWLIRAGERRPSRFHDYAGRLVPLTAMHDLPAVVWECWQRRVRDQRPALPWVPYPVIRRLRQLIQPDWAVLEYGSGNSTIWLASRVSRLRSVESDPTWYKLVRGRLPAGIQYELVDMDAGYYCAISAAEVNAYHLVIVDGHFREACLESALSAVRPGGHIYLDNIDSQAAVAFSRLRQAVEQRGGDIELLTGFPPAQLTVTTGALARLLS